MEGLKENVIVPTLGRVGTMFGGGAAGSVIATDHSAVIQGALVALAGVAIDIALRWLRDLAKRS